jgi:ABC-type dipeptide/oligopeptide/nickel transport system permease component
MVNYIIRRLLLLIPTIIGVTMVTFFVMALSPGGVGGAKLDADGGMQAKQRQALQDYYERRYGLNKPMVVQYLRWLNQVSPVGFTTDPVTYEYNGFSFKAPDLGTSFSRNRPVTALFKDALPVTMMLNLLAMLLTFPSALAIGVLAARFRGKFFDTATNISLLALWSVPMMLVGVLLLGYLATTQYLNWFPNNGYMSSEAVSMPFLPSYNAKGEFVKGYLLDVAWHLCLPVICLTYGAMAFDAKLTRASVLENIMSDYARTARAKGVSEGKILFSHVFRNSLLPLITISAGLLPSLFGGSVIVERIFSLPGMGDLMVEAIFSRDREVVMASALVLGTLGLLCQLIADVCYTIADPRVTYE